MKLSSVLVERTLSQFDAQPIPESHPAIPQLNKIFGDHTFFLDDGGLHVVEPVAAAADGSVSGKIIKLADWRDAKKTTLEPCDPEETEITVLLVPEDEEDGEPTA